MASPIPCVFFSYFGVSWVMGGVDVEATLCQEDAVHVVSKPHKHKAGKRKKRARRDL